MWRTSGACDSNQVTVLSRRNRCVIFRVSEQEYESLKSACDAAGTRSLSDYTRSKLFMVEKAKTREDRIVGSFLNMNQKLTELYQLTKQVFESLQAESHAEMHSSNSLDLVEKDRSSGKKTE